MNKGAERSVTPTAFPIWMKAVSGWKEKRVTRHLQGGQSPADTVRNWEKQTAQKKASISGIITMPGQSTGTKSKIV